jgi:hypothetical protein
MPGATKDGMPIVGEHSMFAGPKDNASRGGSLPSKPKDKVEEAFKTVDEIAAGKNAVSDPILKPKEQLYEENLQKVGLTLREARSIMEQMVTKGYYEEETKIGSLTAIIRTRVYEDMIRAQRALELYKPDFSSGVQELLNRYNTAASLVRYGDHHFTHPDPFTASDEEIETAFQPRLRLVTRLPHLVSIRLQQNVFEFDGKMMAVFGEGAPQDF